MQFVKNEDYHTVLFTGAKLKAKSTEDRICTLQFAWIVTHRMVDQLPEIVRHSWPAIIGREPAAGVDLETFVKSQNFTFRSTPASRLAILELWGYKAILRRLDHLDGKDQGVLRFEIESGVTAQVAQFIVGLLGSHVSMKVEEGQRELRVLPTPDPPKVKAKGAGR